MNPTRSIRSAAFALALAATLATLGSLNLLAQDEHASSVLAQAATSQQAVAARPALPAPRT